MFILRINKMIGFLFLTLDMSNLLYLKKILFYYHNDIMKMTFGKKYV